MSCDCATALADILEECIMCGVLCNKHKERIDAIVAKCVSGSLRDFVEKGLYDGPEANLVKVLKDGDEGSLRSLVHRDNKYWISSPVVYAVECSPRLGAAVIRRYNTMWPRVFPTGNLKMRKIISVIMSEDAALKCGILSDDYLFLRWLVRERRLKDLAEYRNLADKRLLMEAYKALV